MDIDLTTITDVKELKSLAYDQLAMSEQLKTRIAECQENVNKINSRIVQVVTEERAKAAEAKAIETNPTPAESAAPQE